MAADDGFTAFLLDMLRPLGPVSARRMFGGTGIWHGGQMFALVASDALYLKVGDANRAAFEARGQAPFSYPTRTGDRHTIGSYWSCPPELLDEPDEFRAWARRSVSVALAAAKPRPARRGG